MLIHYRIVVGNAVKYLKIMFAFEKRLVYLDQSIYLIENLKIAREKKLDL